MVANVFYDKDADSSFIESKTVAVIGYGSQGHAHALNMKDNGVKVIIGLYEGSSSWAKAEADGFEVMKTSEATENADVIMMLLPDTSQAEVYKNEVEPNLTSGKSLAFAHGFTIHYETIVPNSNIDVWMIAPKAPGHRVRAVFQQGNGVPSLIAVHQDYTGNAQNIALAYAQAIGSMRAGVLETTFKEETETDLFGEQAVLCGGVTSLVQAAYETMVEAGYQPESAYFEVMHELKLIVDLLYEGGMEYMWYSVSDTAEYGGLTRGPRIIDERVKENMKKVMEEIQNGTFAREWIAENDEGRPTFHRTRKENASHPIESIGKDLRGMMPWLKDTV